MTATEHKNTRHKRRWVSWPVGGVVLVFVLAAMAVWGWRKDLAGYLLGNWCAERGWECSGEITHLGFGGLEVDRLQVKGLDGVPLVVPYLDVRVGWAGWFKPQVNKITADAPVVSGRLDQGGVSLYGLESLLTTSNDTGENGDTPVPVIEVQNGMVQLATSAGNLLARVNLSGRPFKDGRVEISFPPNQLNEKAGGVDWSVGDILIDFDNGVATGDVVLDLETAVLGDYALVGADVQARLSDANDEIMLIWSGSAKEIRNAERYAENLEMSGSVIFAEFETLSISALWSAVKSATVQAEIAALDDPAFGAGKTELTFDVARTEGVLAGPSALTAQMLQSESGTLEQVTLSGDVRVPESPEKGVEFAGAVLLEGAGLSEASAGTLFSPTRLSSPFEHHGNQLYRTAIRAASQFDLGVEFSANWIGGDIEITARRPTLLKANSGLSLSIDPDAGMPWVRYRTGGLEFGGVAELSGGGAPTLSTRIDSAKISQAKTHIILRDLSLQRWTVQERAYWAQLDHVDLRMAEHLQIMFDGEIGLAGNMPGAKLGQTRLFGSVKALEGVEGWRVETLGNGCVGFANEGVEAGGLILAPIGLSLCPDARRFLWQERGQSVGRLPLGALDLPFRTADATGALRLSQASLEWFTGDEFQLFFKGDRLQLPLAFGENTIGIDGASPTVTVSARDGPVKIDAAMAATQFDGSLVPVDASAASFVFDGQSSSGGVNGAFDIKGVRIADPGQDPLFEPIITDLAAQLTEGRFLLSGDVQREVNQGVIGDVSLDIGLADFTGAASVRLRPLTFAPGIFQPHDLSERLRGVLVNAQGQFAGAANFQIDGGQVEGTGNVSVIDLTFDTVKVGTVKDVNGQIDFTDVFSVTTPPSQTVTIGEINPGLPLTDGVLEFQLKGPSLTVLQGAHWPFAGGTLSVQPTQWQLGVTQQRVVVQADRIELEELVDVFSVPDLEATGTVSGVFPVDIDGANIYIRDASLEADETGGTVSYTGAATNDLADENDYAEFAFEALKDFEFTVMRIGANGNLIGDIRVTADIVGRNEDVLDGAVFDFGITIDSKLAQLLQSFANAPTETYIDEALKKAQSE